ncbi:hypothetical protein SELMODRAFT_107197 [Selaginella moellendorffii]|uniref:Cupin type-1 domain-containing protein n=1 Tax=Selaginella moellendorffii TaxID=88036 RepID=D8S1U0_SELML|nr:hypothetical protein SELMODRAFT_107197 [Selaginella moellendorffii]
MSCLCLLLVAFVILCDHCHGGSGRSSEDHLLQRISSSKEGSSPLILEEPTQLVKTQWGEIRVLLSSPLLRKHNVGLGFITLRPRALLLPHYLDASFVFLVQQGSARIGWVDQQGELLRQDLSTGDVYAVAAGSLFYLLSTHEDEELEIYGLYDTSEAIDIESIKPFFIAGKSNLFSGFGTRLVSAAFKVSEEGVAEFLSQQPSKAIIPTSVDAFAQLTSHLPEAWSWKNVASFLLNKKMHGRAPRPLSLTSSKRSFANQNGCFASTGGKKLPVLRKSRLGVSFVNLKNGALLAPHWNPQAMVVGVVTNGTGRIQIAHPNGTNALNRRLEEGTIFVVPRYFPNCELSSRDAPLKFLGFTVSDEYHGHGQLPQFLIGKSSVLDKLDMETLALSFNMPEELVASVLGAQQDENIFSLLESESDM